MNAYTLPVKLKEETPSMSQQAPSRNKHDKINAEHHVAPIRRTKYNSKHPQIFPDSIPIYSTLSAKNNARHCVVCLPQSQRLRNHLAVVCVVTNPGLYNAANSVSCDAESVQLVLMMHSPNAPVFLRGACARST